MTFRFRWNGREVSAESGDSIAAALIAAGHQTLGATSKGRPRSHFCGMGICQECLVVVDGRPNQQSCLVTAREGMSVRSQSDAESAPTDWDKGGSSGLPDPNVDLAVLGAGPAGLNAALVAASSGMSVVIVDERSAAGGQYFKPRATGFRGHFRQDDQHRRGAALRDRVATAGVGLRLAQTVWYARRGEVDFDLRTTGAGGIGRISARALVVAAGAHEIAPIVPGWTLPGTLTIGAAQTLARRYGVVPGRRILIAGNGPLGLQLAAELIRLGGQVVAVAERARLIDAAALAHAASTNPRLVLQGAGYAATMLRAGVKFLRGWELMRIDGGREVKAAVLRRLSDGVTQTVDVDTVCIGEGFAPQLEIARLLGVPITFDPNRGLVTPQRDQIGATNVPGLWIAGDAGGLGGSEVAEAQGALAGHAAAVWLGRAADKPLWARRKLRRASSFQKALWGLYEAPRRAEPSGETTVCRCEGVSASALAGAIEQGASDLGAIKRQTRLGMGRCQGRYCVPAALRALHAHGISLDAHALFAPQVPVKPVPISMLAHEKAEWGGHVESRPSARPFSPSREPLGQTKADLVVIGGGITGIAAAYFAGRQGAKVLVLERGRLNAEASGGNAGSLHLQLLSWDFGNKAVGGGDLQLRTLPLQQESIGLWRQLEREIGADFEFAVTGGLMVAESLEQRRFLEQKVAAEARFGIESEVIGADRIHEIAPSISELMVAAAWCPGEGKINPLAASLALIDAARRIGVVFEELAPVEGIEPSGSGYRVSTPRGDVHAGRVLVAAGGWSAEIGSMLGVAIPVRGAPLQMIVTEPTGPILPCLVAHADRHLTMKQTSASTILIGGAWTAATDRRGQPIVLPGSLEGNVWVAARTVPAVAGLRVVRSWAAMNIDIDGAPLLGQVPGHPGVVVAATANGYTLGPLMGREAAHLSLAGAPRGDLEPFGFGRFQR